MAIHPEEDFIHWLDSLLERSRKGEKVNGLIDKPRDVGATFTAMTWTLYHYLFDEFSARIGSRKEDYVPRFLRNGCPLSQPGTCPLASQASLFSGTLILGVQWN
jgi:hypothetical protein